MGGMGRVEPMIRLTRPKSAGEALHGRLEATGGDMTQAILKVRKQTVEEN